jgi:hypothetical protein
MTVTMKKSISFALVLTTFVTGLVAFGRITTTAYNYNQYPITCPSDFPYCDYKPSSNPANYCDVFATNCVTDDSKYDYSTIDKNNTSYTNYNTKYYGTSMCYYYSYLCSTSEYQTPTKSNDIYYTDYCAYLNAKNCQNITVNPPKTYNSPSDTYIIEPTYTDPIRNCYLNTTYCYGGTVNTNTAANYQNGNYYFENFTPITGSTNNFTTSINDQFSNTLESNQSYYQDYSSFDSYPIASNYQSYDYSNEMLYYSS